MMNFQKFKFRENFREKKYILFYFIFFDKEYLLTEIQIFIKGNVNIFLTRNISLFHKKIHWKLNIINNNNKSRKR